MCYNDLKIQAIQYCSVSIDGKVSGGLRLSVFVCIACHSLLAYHNPLGHCVDKNLCSIFHKEKANYDYTFPNTKFWKKKKNSLLPNKKEVSKTKW